MKRININKKSLNKKGGGNMTNLSKKEQTLLGRLIDNFLKLSLEDQQYILGRTEEKAEQAMVNNSNNKKIA